MRSKRHSPLCKKKYEVALRHDRDMLWRVASEAIQFIENSPPRAVFIKHGDPKQLEIRCCRYCGHAQVQFEKPRHHKGCIVRIIRGCLKRSDEHMHWHEFKDERYREPYRDEYVQLRRLFKLMEKPIKEIEKDCEYFFKNGVMEGVDYCSFSEDIATCPFDHKCGILRT